MRSVGVSSMINLLIAEAKEHKVLAIWVQISCILAHLTGMLTLWSRKGHEKSLVVKYVIMA